MVKESLLEEMTFELGLDFVEGQRRMFQVEGEVKSSRGKQS